MNATFIPSRRQQVWGWPAVINFTVASSGAGLWLFQMAADYWTTAQIASGASKWALWAGPFLLAGGMAPLAFEAGRPGRAWRALWNLRTSWMSRESLAAVVFLAASSLAITFSSAMWAGLASIAALAFVVAQGCIIWRCKAVPAWHTSRVIWFFLGSGLLSGSALGLVVASWQDPSGAQARFALGVTSAALLLDVGFWVSYLCSRGEADLRQHTTWLRGRTHLIVGLCRVLPAAMLSAVQLQWMGRGVGAQFACGLAAVLTLLGAGVQKSGLLRQCGYLREITLPHADRSPRPWSGIRH